MLLFFILLTSVKGINRFANVCSAMMPPFMLVYMALGIWIIADHYSDLPNIFSLILSSFLDYKSQVGGVAAGGILLNWCWREA